MTRLKRAYEKPSPDDGFRVLVDRFWPRDLDEKHAKIDLWLKEVAPSEQLHVQFGEDPGPREWDEFQSRYRAELEQKHKVIKLLRKKMHEGTLTLVHAAHHPERSAATVLRQFLEEERGSSPEQV